MLKISKVKLSKMMMGATLAIITVFSLNHTVSNAVIVSKDEKMAIQSDFQVSSVADNIEKEALKHVGAPYTWGGNGPKVFDTAGFTQYVYGKQGIKLPRTPRQQYQATVVIEENELSKGDLVFFTSKTNSNHITQVGIYLEKGQFISANSEGVTINSLDEEYWKNVYFGATRVVYKENQKPLVDYFVYVKAIDMPFAHQEYLFEKSKEAGLDYAKVLAVISMESKFNQDYISKGKDYGYFGINQTLHSNLAKVTKTENKPLNPYVNIDWGIELLSDAQNYWMEKDFTGSELDHFVWSSFFKGVLSVEQTGVSKYYNLQVEKNLNKVKKSLKSEVKQLEL